MRFHVASYTPSQAALRTFSRSPWPLLGAGLFCLLIFLGALAGWFGLFHLDGQPLHWRISLEIAVLPLFLAGVCLYMARLSMRQASWLVKLYPDGMLLNARLTPSTKKSQDSGEGVALFFLEWKDVAWARLRNEIRYVRTPMPGHRQRREEDFVELECVSGQVAYLRGHLAREAARQGLCPDDFCPLELTDDNHLLLRWDVTPGAEEFLKAIAGHIPVREPVHLTV
ncbi:hypothetical protein [Megalodesulfovibrio paquesii]